MPRQAIEIRNVVSSPAAFPELLADSFGNPDRRKEIEQPIQLTDAVKIRDRGVLLMTSATAGFQIAQLGFQRKHLVSA